MLMTHEHTDRQVTHTHPLSHSLTYTHTLSLSLTRTECSHRHDWDLPGSDAVLHVACGTRRVHSESPRSYTPRGKVKGHQLQEKVDVRA